MVSYDGDDLGKSMNEAFENSIRLVYNTPELHGSYCPCERCEKNMGPMHESIHKIGKKGLPDG